MTPTTEDKPATVITIEYLERLENMVTEIHSFCYKLDQLLGKAERALPMVLAAMPPEMAQQVMGG